MKKKMTLQKATVAVGVVAMSVGFFNSFNAEANEGSCSVDRSGVSMHEDLVPKYMEFKCMWAWRSH